MPKALLVVGERSIFLSPGSKGGAGLYFLCPLDTQFREPKDPELPVLESKTGIRIAPLQVNGQKPKNVIISLPDTDSYLEIKGRTFQVPAMMENLFDANGCIRDPSCLN